MIDAELSPPQSPVLTAQRLEELKRLRASLPSKPWAFIGAISPLIAFEDSSPEHDYRLTSEDLRSINDLMNALPALLSLASTKSQQWQDTVAIAQRAFDAAVDMAAEHVLRIGDYAAQSKADGIRDEAFEAWANFKKTITPPTPTVEATNREAE